MAILYMKYLGVQVILTHNKKIHYTYKYTRSCVTLWTFSGQLLKNKIQKLHICMLY